MQGCPGSCGASNIFLCRIPHNNIQASAQNLTIIYMMFPPLTLPNKEANDIKGKRRNISRRKTTNAYILNSICIKRRKSFINKHEYIISAGRISKKCRRLIVEIWPVTLDLQLFTMLEDALLTV